MLEFLVFDEHGPANSWPLVNAHLVGQDEVPVPGGVRFKNGRVVCQKRGNRAVGLALVYDAGRMGRLMLHTSLLPDRDAPYILSVELARHRIKMFIVKSEEWQMFDLSAEHPAMQLWEEARRLFTDAVTQTDPAEADRLARTSLESAIDATERLALAHAEILLHRRFASRRASSATLGVRIWPPRDGQGLRDLISREFDVLVLPMVWRELEIEEGRYNWEPLDRWVQWAREQSKPIVAGPLLDFSKGALPDWMYVWQHDYDTCRDMAYDHVERVVQRYRNAVAFWNLASGINVNDNFRFSPEQMVDLVRMVSLIVRQSRKGARMMVELSQPFSEHAATQNDSMPAMMFLDRLTQEGIRMDALGVQLLFGQGSHGRTTRDLMQISSLLDRFFVMELPVLVSTLGVPSRTVDEDGGHWQKGWLPDVQAKWVGQVFAMAMSKPFVESVFWTDLFDHDRAQLPGAGLIDEQGRSRPALQKLLNMRRRLRKPLGPLKLPSKTDPTLQP